MNAAAVGVIICSLALASCAPPLGESDAEIRARRHMKLAETFEAADELREAAFEYTIVGELYPGTNVHPAAVRKAAILYADPSTPVHSDSAALFWFGVYSTLPISSAEKETAQTCMLLLQRVHALRLEADNYAAVNDTLRSTVAGNIGEMSSRAKRIQELEAELKQANDELQKLREVDVEIGKKKVRK